MKHIILCTIAAVVNMYCYLLSLILIGNLESSTFTHVLWSHVLNALQSRHEPSSVGMVRKLPGEKTLRAFRIIPWQCGDVGTVVVFFKHCALCCCVRAFQFTCLICCEMLLFIASREMLLALGRPFALGPCARVWFEGFFTPAHRILVGFALGYA